MKKFLATICMTAMMAFAFPSHFTVSVCPLMPGYNRGCETYKDATFYMHDGFIVIQTKDSKIFYNMQGWSIKMELK